QKTRRRVTESELLETLESGLFAKILLLLGAAAGLVWIVLMGTSRLPSETSLVAILIYGTAVAHLCLNRPEVWNRNSRLLLLCLVLLTHLAMVKACLLLANDAVRHNGELLPGQFSSQDKRVF